MKIVFLVLFSVLLASCPSDKKEGSFTTLAKGSLHGAGKEGFKEQNIVIQSEEEWKNFLSKLNNVNTETKDLANTIDFSKYSVIAVIDQVRNSGGFSIKVQNIEPKENKLEVSIEKKDGKSPGGMAIMILEQPYHVVRIPKTSKEIIFKK